VVEERGAELQQHDRWPGQYSLRERKHCAMCTARYQAKRGEATGFPTNVKTRSAMLQKHNIRFLSRAIDLPYSLYSKVRKVI
jgi:hypothetical protein